ncbi:MAG: phosphoglycerate dehydrogenase [Anaerofustis sp.]
MYKIRTFNKIDNEGMQRLPNNFEVVDGEDYDGIILRSYAMSEAELTDRLCAVARAGAGVNNIPVDLYAQHGVVVFNTPGANANAVKELVVLGMLLSARKVVDGINWVQSLKGTDVNVEKEVEAQKSKYAGPELLGKKAGVIGLGAIGVKAANLLEAMGMDVIGYDPFISVEAAWGLNCTVKRTNSIEWIFENCDYVTIHIPLMDSTKCFVNDQMIARAKDGIRVMNFARGGLCSDDAIVRGVESGKIACYVTDFPNEKLLGYENIVTIPHLGASTPESETNCAIMAADQIAEYLVNGNIINSVNYPNCNMGTCSAKARVTINHKNVPNMVGQITTVMANNGINISDMINKSKGDFAYTMMDVDHEITDDALNALRGIEGVLKVRKL